ncbi:MAG: hypothetical protein R3D46_10130 [Defluviimonas denitrificans]
MLIKQVLLGGSLAAPGAWFGLLCAWARLGRTRGLNPGEAFELWLDQLMTRRAPTAVAVMAGNLRKIRHTLDQIDGGGSGEVDLRPHRGTIPRSTF